MHKQNIKVRKLLFDLLLNDFKQEVVKFNDTKGFTHISETLPLVIKNYVMEETLSSKIHDPFKEY